MAGKSVAESLARSEIVKQYARMWPRDVFDYPGKKRKYLADELEILQQPGIYVLYRDDLPYYVGKTDGALCKRLYVHAKRPGGRYDYFWNYFSVFVVEKARDRTIVESILIAAMPTANSAKPKAFERHRVPPEIIQMIRDQREHQAKLGRAVSGSR